MSSGSHVLSYPKKDVNDYDSVTARRKSADVIARKPIVIAQVLSVDLHFGCTLVSLQAFRPSGFFSFKARKNYLRPTNRKDVVLGLQKQLQQIRQRKEYMLLKYQEEVRKLYIQSIPRPEDVRLIGTGEASHPTARYLNGIYQQYKLPELKFNNNINKHSNNNVNNNFYKNNNCNNANTLKVYTEYRNNACKDHNDNYLNKTKLNNYNNKTLDCYNPKNDKKSCLNNLYNNYYSNNYRNDDHSNSSNSNYKNSYTANNKIKPYNHKLQNTLNKFINSMDCIT
ncbi:hypothetical protein HELRODRAFT_164844 [Helobdella robusta]|uniref:Uncharacterized protein n=1 Tax=Helobdella robusta TaxID=6412 RepID=T1EVV8_HELRO|nr:hypothetical protein HELRODRAFT_164844 [Helobdella robusta]ESN92745.1 hypothetical protein HELRODRAFT_164844 [Helobdella robusta]